MASMPYSSRPLDSEEAFNPWMIAKARFLEGLDERDRVLFNEATIENLYYSASNIERQDQKESKSRNILRDLQPLVSAVEDYGKALDAYANIAPTYLAPIWGSIRVIIALASRFGKFYGRMVDMFGRIGDILPRFRDYQKIFDVQRHQRFSQALSAAYLDIIILCTEFRNLLLSQKKSAVKRFLQPISPALHAHLEESVTRFRNHRKEVEKEAEICHMIEEKLARDLVLRNHEAAKARERESRQKRLIAQVSTINHQYKHRRMRNIRHPGTGTWFVALREFKEWLNCTRSSVLCCYGIPGSGKSVLTSSIIDQLLAAPIVNGIPKSSTVFYYCDHADKRTLDPLNIFKNILHQLLQFLGELSESVLSIIEDTFQDGSRVPDAADVYQVLLTIIHQFSITTILIDGVDEVVEDDRNFIFSHLKTLLTDGSPTLVKLFISGREDITNMMHVPETSNAKVRITPDTIAGDIDNYVKYAVQDLVRIGDLKFGDPSLEDEVVLALANGAKGMFLWVKFQLTELCSAQTDGSIRKALQNLPRDLSETYERLLARIEGTEIQEFIRRMFRWIIFAKRPLVMEELQEAIAFTTDDTFWTAERIPNDLLRLIRMSGHLIVVDEETQIVQLAHYTIQQYLLDQQRVTPVGFVIRYEDANSIIGKICMTYLSFSDFETQIIKQDVDAVTPWFNTMQAALANQSLLPYHPRGKALNAVMRFRTHEFKQPNIDFARYVPKKKQLNVDLIEKYRLLSYISENWLWHTISLDDGPMTAHFNKLVLSKSLLFNFRPWDGLEEPDPEYPNLLRLGWAINANHLPLLKLCNAQDNLKAYFYSMADWVRASHESPTYKNLMNKEIDITLDTVSSLNNWRSWLFSQLLNAARQGLMNTIKFVSNILTGTVSAMSVLAHLFLEAAIHSQVDILRYLVEEVRHHTPWHMHLDYWGVNPLDNAFFAANVPVMQFLLEKKFSLSRSAKFQILTSPKLATCARRGNALTTKCLLLSLASSVFLWTIEIEGAWKAILPPGYPAPINTNESLMVSQYKIDAIIAAVVSGHMEVLSVLLETDIQLERISGQYEETIGTDSKAILMALCNIHSLTKAGKFDDARHFLSCNLDDVFEDNFSTSDFYSNFVPVGSLLLSYTIRFSYGIGITKLAWTGWDLEESIELLLSLGVKQQKGRRDEDERWIFSCIANDNIARLNDYLQADGNVNQIGLFSIPSSWAFKLEEHHYDLELQRLGGITPLICAILFRRLEIARILLREGCSTEERDQVFGYTPLQFAIIVNSLEFVELLNEYRVLFKVVDKNKRNILYFALECKSCCSRVAILQYIVAQDDHYWQDSGPIDVILNEAWTRSRYLDQPCIVVPGLHELEG